MKLIKTLFQIAILGCLLPLSNCVQPINFANENPEKALVIEGSFNNLRERQEFHLWETNGFDGAPIPIANASVRVRCTDGRSAAYSYIDKGLYVLDTTNRFFGEVGKAYFIEIDNGTTTYQSDPEIMPEVIVPDSAFWDAGKQTSLSSQGIVTAISTIDAFVSTPLKRKNTEGYLRWRVDDAFQFTTQPSCTPFGNTETCYYSKQSSPQIVNILSSRETGLEKSNKIKLISEPVEPYFKFNELHYFSVYQFSITEKAYDYWRQYNAIVDQNGSIFDRVPAAIKGNVYNKNDKNDRILGYFEVAAGAITRTFTRGGEVREKFPSMLDKDAQCPMFVQLSRFWWINACCDCLYIKATNATKTKPSYWWR
jgi:hypothetical protein